MNLGHLHRRNTARRGWRSGNAIIEMAIVFPILLWLSMGMVEFGQFFYIRSAFVAAARDGCRKATLASATLTNVQSTISTTLLQANVTFNTAWVKYYDINTGGGTTQVSDPSSVPSGDGVEVALTVTYDQIPNCFRPLYAITGKGIGTGKVISVQTVMVKE